MPHAIWSGAISFGLVNVPVRMYSAIDEQDLHFHLLHTKDDSRIGYEKVCKKEGKPVPDDEIAKAYEFSEGEYVYMTDEDFEAAAGEKFKSIDIRDFVPYDDIDPIYFERTYYLGPADGTEKVYALLRRAMESSGLAAIATYVMREKEQLGCLRITYRKSLLSVIKQKRMGKEVHVEARLEDEEPPDLLAALRASLDRHAGANGKRARGRNGGHRLEQLSKSELEERARKAKIAGRSKMSKDELVEALEAA